eukprot:scaffold5352_cov112-Isochrysis_galbana.AAC.2
MARRKSRGTRQAQSQTARPRSHSRAASSGSVHALDQTRHAPKVFAQPSATLPGPGKVFSPRCALWLVVGAAEQAWSSLPRGPTIWVFLYRPRPAWSIIARVRIQPSSKLKKNLCSRLARPLRSQCRLAFSLSTTPRPPRRSRS